MRTGKSPWSAADFAASARERIFRQLLERKMVPEAGLEPACLAAADFESAASTIPPLGQTIACVGFNHQPKHLARAFRNIPAALTFGTGVAGCHHNLPNPRKDLQQERAFAPQSECGKPTLRRRVCIGGASVSSYAAPPCPAAQRHLRRGPASSAGRCADARNRRRHDRKSASVAWPRPSGSPCHRPPFHSWRIPRA